MIYANVFGKIAGVIFYVCIGISIVILAYGGVRRLIEVFKTRKKRKQAEKDVLNVKGKNKDDSKRKENA